MLPVGQFSTNIIVTIRIVFLVVNKINFLKDTLLYSYLKKKNFCYSDFSKKKIQHRKKEHVNYHTIKLWETFCMIPLFFLTENSILCEIKTTITGTNTWNL